MALKQLLDYDNPLYDLLLIAPNGIETHVAMSYQKRLILLIAPNGIETRRYRFSRFLDKFF